MSNVYKDLSGVKNLDLHYAIGVNCYQHARGYPHPIIGIIPGGPEFAGKIQILHYFALLPGNASSAIAPPPHTVAELEPFILRACQEDNITLIDRKIDTELAGDLTLGAIYFSKENTTYGLQADFHFAIRRKDGQWEDKIPFSEKKVYTELPSEIDGYVLSKFLLIPNEIPLGIQKLTPQFRTLTNNGDSLDIAVVNPNTIYNGNHVVISMQQQRAIIMRTKEEIPLPYCPKELQTPYVCTPF